METINNQKVVWRATPKQEVALVIAWAFEILFGGARGGGKTDAGMAWLIYDIAHPRFRGLVIRKNAKDLDDWTERAKVMYRPLRAKFTQGKIVFPSGATIVLGHLKDENAYEQYQGHEYHRMLIEELEQIPSEELYLKLISSCRSTVEGLTPQIFSTANPGGRGQRWIKRRFDLPNGVPRENIITVDPISKRKRVFVPARVYDNPYIMSKDPNYVHFLESLPDGLREAWLDGNWSEMEIKGAYYAKQIRQARKEGRITQVPYDDGALVHTVWDLGIGKNLTIGFYQKVEGEIHMIDFWQGDNKDAIPQAKIMLDQKNYALGMHFAPHDVMKTESNGKTIRETAKKFGIEFQKIPNVAVDDGILQGQLVFPRLWIDEVKCEDWLEAMRNYRKEWDEVKQDWKLKPEHDWASHPADVHRYMALIEDILKNTLDEVFIRQDMKNNREQYGNAEDA